MMMLDSWKAYMQNGQKEYSISNEIGHFERDATGLLKRFSPSIKNQLFNAPMVSVATALQKGIYKIY